MSKEPGALQEEGYEHMLFITHSTGGIIVLQYLVDRLDDAIESNNYDTMELPTVLAWSTPIKGLR